MHIIRLMQTLVLLSGFMLPVFTWFVFSVSSVSAASRAEDGGLSAIAPHAPRATIAVVNTNDSGVGSLRAQIAAAKSGDTIVFDPAVFSTPVTITLTTGEITINKNLTIDATSVAMPSISGNTKSRVYSISAGFSVTMTKLAIINGNCGAACDGGGIYNLGTLTVMNSTFSGNRADNFGGGIYNNNTLMVTNSTFSGNRAGLGGGGVHNDGALTVTNSTFSENSTTNGGGILNTSTLAVTNSTFSGNDATNGGGIYHSGVTATLKNTIVANSTSGGNCEGVITDGGYNLDSGASCGFSSANNSLSNTDPRLAPLGNYGGATQTFAILADSPARNRIPNGTNGCGTTITTDQRGVSRPQMSACDIGAYEWDNNIVKNTNDSGAGSLRQVVLDVAPNDTVIFDPIVFSAPVTITLTTGQITLGKNMTIDATSVAMPSISGNNASRVFSITVGVNVAMTKLTIANGYCYGVCSGGGIANNGMLAVTNSTFSGNNAYRGGGIYNDYNSTLTVTNSTFSGNNMPSDPGGLGGGIFNYGTLIVTNSTFSGNSAPYGGGGIENYNSLIVTNSTFSGNSAPNGGGGGIRNIGTLTVTNSTFSGNSAPYGGGIYNVSTLTVTNSTFSGNSASTSGGGINNSVAGTATLKNTIVANSTSGGNCGGVITNGGYNLDSGTICGFSSANNSLSNTDPRLAPLGNYGGATQTFAILADSPAMNRIPNGTNGCGTTITTDQRGVSRPQMNACDIGAYEWNNIVKNTNDNGVGSLRQVVADSIADDKVLFDPAVFNASVTITLTTGQITLDKNVSIDATSVMTPSISGNNTSCIFSVGAGVSVTMTKLSIVNAYCDFGRGGGINNNGTLAVTNSVFSGNNATWGGGIFNFSTLTVTNSTFFGNSALPGGQGGGIYNYGTLTVMNSTFRENSTTNAGGGIFNDHGTLTVTNSTFSGNNAPAGGGICNNEILTVTNSTFSGNTATFGGGILNNGTLALTNSTFSGNSAISGGGIWNAGTATLKNTIVANITSGGNCAVSSGSITDGGYNLDSGTTCGFSSANNSLSNTNPLLGSLGNNGGPTQTFALLTGSPAIDKIPQGTNGCGTTITTDQRGVKRPLGSRCDMGAYEASVYLFLPLILR